MKAKHNQPYYKKVYNRDTKNLKILIGHGYKQPKYAKKGGPFKLDPPKRRPVGKLSAPPMVLDEEEQTQKVINDTEAFLLGLQNGKQGDILKFYVKERQNLNPGSFCPGDQEYSANFISNDKIEVMASFVIVGSNCTDPSKTKKQTKTKAEVLATFKNTVGNKDICAVLDCKNSTWNGKRLDAALNKLKQQASLQQKPKAKTQEKPKTKTQEKRAKDLRTSSAVVSSIAKGENVDAVLEKDLFASYGTSPYHPVAKEFSEKFNKLINKSLEKISDPDEKKMAALTAVIFGTIGMNVTSAIAETAAMIPKEYYQEATKVLGALVGTMGADFLKLSGLYDTIIKGKAGDVARDLIKKAKKAVGGGSLIGVPSGNGKKVIFIGNSQMRRSRGVFGRALAGRDYDVSIKNNRSITGTGGTDSAFPSHYHKDASGFKKVERIVQALGGPKEVGAFLINLGDSQSDPWEGASKKMIKDLRSIVPNAAVVWIGAPPKQGTSQAIANRNKSRRENTEAVGRGISGLGNTFFVNPFDYLTNQEPRAMYAQDGSKVHLSSLGHAKLLAAALAGKKVEEETTEVKVGSVAAAAKGLSSKQRSRAALIEKYFTKEGYSKNAIAAAIVNSKAESALNPYVIGDGGAAVGLFQLNSTCKRGGWGLSRTVRCDTYNQFRTLCEDNGVEIDYKASAALARKGLLKDFVKARLDAGDWRFDTIKNIKAIMTDHGMAAFKKAAKEDKGVSELSYVFAAKVERCAKCKGAEGLERKKKATRMFPAGIS